MHELGFNICPNGYELPNHGKSVVVTYTNQEMAVLGCAHPSLDSFLLKPACCQTRVDRAMSNQPAAIKATFSDFRLIRGRKVCQIVLEVPIEEADAALSVLGGLPQPQSERWLGVARLDGYAKPPEKQRFEELKYAMQAGIRCSEPAFRRFLNEQFGREIFDEQEAANFVRQRCGVASRSALNLDPIAAAKWQEIDARYMLWLREPQHA